MYRPRLFSPRRKLGNIEPEYPDSRLIEDTLTKSCISVSFNSRLLLESLTPKTKMYQQLTHLRGYIFQKLLLACFFSYWPKMLFVKGTDTFGHIVVWTIYTSHIEYFMPQHTAFEQSSACLSVFLESLSGLIPFAILWHAGWTLEKKKQLHEHELHYPTTIFRSIIVHSTMLPKESFSLIKNIFCLYRKNIMQVRAFERYIALSWMEFPTLINWSGPFCLIGCWMVFFMLIQILIEHAVGKQWRPW